MTAEWMNPAACKENGRKADEMKTADQYKERLITETMLKEVADDDAEDRSSHGSPETDKT